MCGGLCLSIVGIAGSCSNIHLFTRSRYRRVSCTIFVLIGSLADILILCLGLILNRFINQVLQYDLSAFNLYVCKARLYLVDVFLPVPVWCICLSALNRFCITSRHVIQRQWAHENVRKWWLSFFFSYPLFIVCRIFTTWTLFSRMVDWTVLSPHRLSSILTFRLHFSCSCYHGTIESASHFSPSHES